MSSKPNSQASAEFTSYYLQRATQELSEDLDKVRNAEDFKADSIPFLVHALQQGVQVAIKGRYCIKGISKQSTKAHRNAIN
ncbi:hypothetical protein CEP51_005482 [Fusarium floridanum]|uniref:Ribosome assembly protein 3 n=1 Tax=Fusarium floridanum TaxID=1325733 RepID=A0A428RWQ5_9HYPO|nr:hypothetical protein CEP51_005482 [Fusarium floridanum]